MKLPIKWVSWLREFRGDWESLFKIPKPAIAHIIVKKALTHFVVIVRVTEKFIEIMDPGDGKTHKVSHEEFKDEWTGVLVLISPGEKFSVEMKRFQYLCVCGN